MVPDIVRETILLFSAAALVTVIVLNPDGLVRLINGVTDLFAELLNLGKP